VKVELHFLCSFNFFPLSSLFLFILSIFGPLFPCRISVNLISFELYFYIWIQTLVVAEKMTKTVKFNLVWCIVIDRMSSRSVIDVLRCKSRIKDGRDISTVVATKTALMQIFYCQCYAETIRHLPTMCRRAFCVTSVIRCPAYLFKTLYILYSPQTRVPVCSEILISLRLLLTSAWRTRLLWRLTRRHGQRTVWLLMSVILPIMLTSDSCMKLSFSDCFLLRITDYSIAPVVMYEAHYTSM